MQHISGNPREHCDQFLEPFEVEISLPEREECGSKCEEKKKRATTVKRENVIRVTMCASISTLSKVSLVDRISSFPDFIAKNCLDKS